MRTHIVVHHSLTPKDLPANQAEKSFNNNHKSRGFPLSALGWYIGYQYVIYGDGELRQYRRENEVGAHCKEASMNFKSIGICLSGNFDKELPNPEQIESLEKLLRALVRTYNIKKENIVPHRHFATYKSCYGSKLSNDWASNLFMEKYKIDIREVMGKDGKTIFIAMGAPNMEVLEAIKTLLKIYGAEIKPRIPSSEL